MSKDNMFNSTKLYFFVRINIIFLIMLLTIGYCFDKISIELILKSIGFIIATSLLYLRFKTTDDIKKNQEEQFHLTNQYAHFLETSKLLTAKDSTIEAKISAMYLLYDYAKNHPQEIEKVYQLLSEYIKPLLNCIDGDCSNQKYIKVKDSSEIEKLSKKTTYKYNIKKVLNFDITNDKSVETITSWQRNGSETEKLVSIALIIIRDITINILPKSKEHIELSNIIIFNLDIDFVKNKRDIKFKSLVRPTYSLSFFDCNLRGVDFSKSKFYYCKFINCDLDNTNFNDCDLKKTTFINCDFKDATFDNVDLNTLTFKECKNEPQN